jgi:DNA-directed RNA polymerase subunit RPC12/RpoP
MTDDKPRRPILHLKFPAAPPAESDAQEAAPKAPPNVRTTPVAPGSRSTTRIVREFKPASPSRPPRQPRFEAPAPPPKAKFVGWKCKPCGKGFEVSPELADEDAVRCPSCNARLGLARDFRSDPPNIDKVRARLVKG